MKDDDDIEFLLAHFKKMQNTTEVRTSASDKMALSTKGEVGRKKVDISVKKVICIIGQYQTDGHLCKKARNWLGRKKSKMVSGWKG